MKNPNQELIDEAEGLLAKVEKLQPEKGPRDPNIAVAVGGLHTCREQLRWHGESTLEREEKAKAEQESKQKDAKIAKTAPTAAIAAQ